MVNGRTFQQFMCEAPRGTLLASILPEGDWPTSLRESRSETRHRDGPLSWVERHNPPIRVMQGPIRLYVFRTPVDGFPYDPDKIIEPLGGQEIDLGSMPTLVATSMDVDIEITTEDGYYYDVIATGVMWDQGAYRRGIVGGGRLVVGVRMANVPSFLSEDQFKMVAIEWLGLEPEEAQGIRARIVPMTAWGNYGRLAIMGMHFGGSEDGAGYGVMPNHLGGCSSYHGRSVEEVRNFLGV